MLKQRTSLNYLGIASFELSQKGDMVFVTLLGEWRILSLANAAKKVESALASVSGFTEAQIDFSALSYIDSSAILFFLRLKKENPKIRLIGFSYQTKALFRLVSAHTKRAVEIPQSVAQKKRISFFEGLGRLVHEKTGDFFAYSEFLGSVIVLFGGIFKKHNFRFSSIVRQIELSSVNALPIVALTALLIGVVVTYQGSLQLSKFGAAIFTIDLVGMSIARELAPLLTAIVIAGRSGASYTSEIGVMKITEEIDAMKTMGFSPYYFLVFPRILALTFTLWFVILFADVVALMGAFLISKLQLGISYTEFIERLHTTLELKHVFVGLFKAPFFAFLIASIGVFRGFQVDKSSESIGAMTTHSVVNSIFAVVACDAIIAVIFTRIGI